MDEKKETVRPALGGPPEQILKSSRIKAEAELERVALSQEL